MACRTARRIVAAAVLALAAAPATAQPEADRQAIIARLEGWAAAFNAGDAAGACALFARDVVAITQGGLEAGWDAVCGRLRAALGRPGIRLHYTPEIREVILAGDLAVVRLLWTLTARRDGHPPVTTHEAGLDIFRRQPDGTWSIARFMAVDVEAPATR
jgi:steroid delta-isomerase